MNDDLFAFGIIIPITAQSLSLLTVAFKNHFVIRGGFTTMFMIDFIFNGAFHLNLSTETKTDMSSPLRSWLNHPYRVLHFSCRSFVYKNCMAASSDDQPLFLTAISIKAGFSEEWHL
ncbi:hypothetical protein CEXT_64971 [Caerostris extrusa]|uniref:Uncharacterized protein n=1 Tax=Caerostris extrusa TaxID=172846 RepID=A0AAV4VKX3_CAEEX|nr:hypothetical protein CEXT_64971 [Caerostris extrusa]